jgi:hypothetical protein
MSSQLSRPQLETDLFVPLRDQRNGKKIRSISTIHNLNVGVVEKSADMTVSGKVVVHGHSRFDGGAIGALIFPDGSPAIEGDGIEVSIRNDKKIVLKVVPTERQFALDQLAKMSGSICDVVDRLTQLERTKAGVGSMIAMNVSPSGEINGQNKLFTLPSAPSPESSLMFFKNGQLLTSGSEADYTISSTNVTLSSAPEKDDVVFALYSYQVPVKSYSINEPISVSVVNNVPTISLLNPPNPPETLMIFMNGQLLSKNEDFSLLENKVTLSLSLKEVQESRFFATYTY